MMTPSKYKRQYYMPPVKCMKWAEKEYVDKAPIWPKIKHIFFTVTNVCSLFVIAYQAAIDKANTEKSFGNIRK